MNIFHALPTDLCKIYFNIILPSTPWSSKWSLSRRFSHQNRVSIAPYSYTRWGFVTYFIFYSLRVRVIGKVCPRIDHEFPEGGVESQLYSFFNLGARRTVLSQRHVSAALPKGKDSLYSFYRRLDRHQGRSGGVRKISPSPGLDPRIVHPVESR